MRIHTFTYYIYRTKTDLIIYKWWSNTCKLGKTFENFWMLSILSKCNIYREPVKTDRFINVSGSLYYTTLLHKVLFLISFKKIFQQTESTRRKYWRCCSFSTSESIGPNRCFYKIISLSNIDCCSANLHLGPDQAQHPWIVWDKRKHRKPAGGPI